VIPPDLVAFLFSDGPKWERIGEAREAHLSYYASDYNRVETNQTNQLTNQLTNYITNLCNCGSSVSLTYQFQS